MARKFKDLSEREILAVAIGLEEEMGCLRRFRRRAFGNVSRYDKRLQKC